MLQPIHMFTTVTRVSTAVMRFTICRLFINPDDKHFTIHLRFITQRLFFFLTLSWCLLSGHGLMAQSMNGLPFIRNYPPSDFNATSGQVFSLAQDTRGILYIGSFDLFEYDGVSWRTIPVQSFVISLASDSASGVIYVGTYRDFGLLISDDQGKTSYKSLLPQDSLRKGSDGFRSIYILKDRVYFLTSLYMYEYTTNTKKLKVIDVPPTGRFGRGYIEKDTLFVEVIGVGLMKLAQNDSLTLVPSTDIFKESKTRSSFSRFSDGRQLVANRDAGVFTINAPVRGNKEIIRVITRPSSPATAALVTKGGYLLIGTLNQGTLLLDSMGNELNHYSISNSLNNNTIQALLSDKTGNLWMGLNAGVAKTEHGMDLSFWNKSNGLAGNVQDIVMYNNEAIVSAFSNVYRIGADGQVTDLEANKKGNYFKMVKFASGSHESVLIASTLGIWELRGRTLTLAIPQVFSTTIYQSRINPDRIIINDRLNLLSFLYKNGTWQREGKWEGVEEDLRDLDEDSQGNIWAKGVYKNTIVYIQPDFKNILQPRSVRYFAKQHGLPDGIHNFPFLIGDDVFAGTAKGLYKFNKQADRFAPYCDFDVKLCESAIELKLAAKDAAGDVYIFSKSETGYHLFHGKKKNQQLQWVIEPFFARLPRVSAIYSCLVEGDTMWICADDEGLFRYNRKKDIKEYAQPFQCLIRKITIGRDSTIYWGGLASQKNINPPTLDFKNNRIRFEYAAPYYDKEQQTYYSYRMAGQENHWSAWSTESKKEYTNIPEGNYQFEVKARNIYGVESNIFTYPFHVLPPWYRTWWAYTLYTVAFALLLFGYARWRTLALKLENTRMEELVALRTNELKIANEELLINKQELIANNEELSATLDKLTSTQRQLIESEKMASLGQLTAGIAHEINNPMNFISGGVQALESLLAEVFKRRKEFSENEFNEIQKEITELMQSVSSGVTRTTSIVTSLKSYASPDQKIHEAFALEEPIQAALHILKSKLTTGSIKLETLFNHRSRARGNAGQICQVLINIIDNAIYAVRKSASQKITIRTEEYAGLLFIRIADTGEGIPEENKSVVFNPFFTTKEVGKGTGLGLSISYSIVTQHGGALTFESAPGEGTEFCITLPVSA